MKRFLILIFLTMFISVSCQNFEYTGDIDYGSAWKHQGVIKLVDVQFTPKNAFAGNSSLVLRFENGLVQIFNDVYFKKTQYIIGTEYDMYEHKVTKKIKIRKVVK